MANEKRFHVSRRKKLVHIRDKSEYEYQNVSDKPRGFWWSCGTSWLDWCEGEDFSVGGYVYSLDIDYSCILQITNLKQFDKFHSDFGHAFPWIPESVRTPFINWVAVAEKYDGIEISPYLYRRRLDNNAAWYYSWDCASGVTWRPSRVVRDLTYIGVWSKGKIPVECAGANG